MFWKAIFVVTLLLAPTVGSGCTGISKRPKAEWLQDFDRADSITLRSDRIVVCSITDADSIQRVRSIYAGSKWTPFRYNTLPGSLDRKVIEICKGDSVLRRFSLLGAELWECTSYEDHRTTPLNAEDRQWLESKFNDGQNELPSN